MKVKTLIVGLGNPGKKYEMSRHNAGFMVLDGLCSDEFKLEKKFNAEVCVEERDSSTRRSAKSLGMTKEGGDKIVLLKPQTFMNLSGEAVRSFADYYKINPENIWVIHDDVDIAFGEIRIKKDGSSAGHKGIESIIKNLGTEDFWRFRIGVKNQDLGKIETDAFVLQKFNDEELKIVPKIVEACVKEIKSGGIGTKIIKVIYLSFPHRI